MFTGLIKEIGTVESICSTSKGLLYRIKSPTLHKSLALGSSVSIDGICQSVTKIFSSGFEAIAGAATQEKSTISCDSQHRWKRGRRVHLEPALSMGDPLDGHIVQGHIKGLVKLERQFIKDQTYILRFSIPPLIKVNLGSEDSVAIDGVSLTVSRAWDRFFEVNILPDTLVRTTFKQKRRGDLFNFEPDFLTGGMNGIGKIKNRLNLSLAEKDFSQKKLLKWGYV